ncbi:MFS transporter [Pseudonocardia sp. D17]|uniref:MFS transporter n=1 Tax=Pseudonocardia sp. D17 TaxID=882661 RepID=UPI0030CEC00A
MSAPAPPATQGRPVRRGATLAAACLGVMMTFLNITATISSLASIQADLHIGNTALVWITSIYSLAVASLVLAAGTAGDIVGRRLVFVIGVGLIGLGSVFAYLSAGVALLLTAQVVIGIGGAMVLPNSLAIVSHTFHEPHLRTEAISIWAGCSGVGLAIGPVVAGALLGHWSWHVVYVVNVVVSVLVVAFALLVVQESRHPDKRLDPLGVLLATIAVAALTFGIIEGASIGYLSGRILGVFALFVVALAVFVIVELRHPDPMVNLRLFRSPSFSTVMVVAVVFMFGFTGCALLMVLYLERVARLSPIDVGLALLPMFGVYVVVSAIAARIVRRLGTTLVMTVGLVVSAGGAFLLLAAGTDYAYAHVWPGFAIFGFGMGLVAAPTTAAAVVSVPPQQAGMASGTVNMFRQLGNVLGASILGTILTSRFTSELPGELAGNGVPAPVAAQVAAAASSGGAPSSALPVSLAARVAESVGSAFTTGFHTGAIVAGVVLLVVAVPTALLVRQRAAVAAPAPPASAPTVLDAVAAGEWAAATGESAVAVSAVAVGAGPAVVGTVRGADGTPLAAAVTLTGPSGEQIGRLSTGPDGTYRIPVGAGGRYLLVASSPARRPHAETVVVGDGPVRHDVTLVGSFAVRGRLADEGGRPVERATVSLIDAVGDVTAVTTSAPDGTFLVDAVADGRYTLTAHHPGCVPVAAGIEVGHDVVDAPGHEIAMVRRARLIGSVVVAGSGRGVAGATATLTDEQDRVVATAVSDEHGRFAFDDVASGTYTLSTRGYDPVVQQVRVEPGRTGSTHVEFPAPDGRAVPLDVVPAEGGRPVVH